MSNRCAIPPWGCCLAELSRDLEQLGLSGESAAGYFDQGPTVRAVSEMIPISIHCDKAASGDGKPTSHERLDIICRPCHTLGPFLFGTRYEDVRKNLKRYSMNLNRYRTGALEIRLEGTGGTI